MVAFALIALALGKDAFISGPDGYSCSTGVTPTNNPFTTDFVSESECAARCTQNDLCVAYEQSSNNCHTWNAVGLLESNDNDANRFCMRSWGPGYVCKSNTAMPTRYSCVENVAVHGNDIEVGYVASQDDCDSCCITCKQSAHSSH